MPISTKVLERVAFTIDLTAFLGMLFLLHSMWKKSLLGLDDAFSVRLANIAERLGWGDFFSNLLLLSKIMCLSTVLFQPLVSWRLNNFTTISFSKSVQRNGSHPQQRAGVTKGGGPCVQGMARAAAVERAAAAGESEPSAEWGRGGGQAR